MRSDVQMLTVGEIDALTAGVVLFSVTALLIGLALTIRALLQERARRINAEAAVQRMRPGPVMQAMPSPHPDDTARQRQIAEAHLAKIQLEVELLKQQNGQREFNRDRMEGSKEFHELMVEKTRLEIEGLRLHITEARKRLEDWQGG